VSKRRKPKPARRQARTPADPTAELARTVLDALGGVLDEPTPLAAEQIVSQMLGMVWASQEYERSEAVDYLVGLLVEQPRAAAHRAGGVLLKVLSELAPGAETRKLAAARYATGGAAWVLPPWVDRVNDVKLVEHRVLGDVYGDQQDHFWVFRYVGMRGAEQHTVITLTDANLHVVKDLFARAGADVANLVPPGDGSQWLDLDLQSSYDDVAHHVELGERTMGEPFGDETAGTWLLLRARMRAMHKRARPLEQQEWTPQQREQLVDEFLAGGARERIVADALDGGELPDDLHFIVGTMVDYAVDYGAGDPLRWSPIAVELFLCDWAPRKVVWDAEDVPWVADVLDAYVAWAGGRTGLAERFIEETRDAVASYSGDFVFACMDGTNRGPAAQMVEAMLQDSVDITDAVAVQDWVDRYNRSLG
jgi:hypothetical protein